MSEQPEAAPGVPRWQHLLLGGIAAAISALAVVVVGLLVIAALRHGQTEDAPAEVTVEAPAPAEPPPAPAEPPPAPEVAEAPAPAASVEPPAAPTPRSTAASPRAAPPPPAEDEPAEVEEPEEPPPPPPPRSTLVRVGVTGDAAGVILDGEGGHYVLPAQVPAGQYLIRATFGEDTVTAGTVTIAPDSPITLSCRGGLKRCTPR